MTKKTKRVTVVETYDEQPVFIAYYKLSCGDDFEWCDKYPPTYCPFCGRLIDYAGGADDGKE